MVKLAETLKKKNKTLWEKFRDGVVNILNKLKKAYAELNPQSEAAQSLMNAQDKLEKIQKLWVEGVVAAAEVSDQVQANEPQPKDNNSDRDVDNYTEKEYNDFGWARANEILSANENETLRSLFASAVSKHSVYPKTKSGEFMIAVGDEVKDKIAYMHGTIDTSVISRVLQIYAFDETELSEIRRMVYEIERRGIKQQTSEVFELYNAFDFRNYDAFKRRFSKGQRYSDEFRTDRGRGSETVDGVEKQRTISTKNSDRTHLP